MRDEVDRGIHGWAGLDTFHISVSRAIRIKILFKKGLFLCIMFVMPFTHRKSLDVCVGTLAVKSARVACDYFAPGADAETKCGR